MFYIYVFEMKTTQFIKFDGLMIVIKFSIICICISVLTCVCIFDMCTFFYVCVCFCILRFIYYILLFLSSLFLLAVCIGDTHNFFLMMLLIMMSINKRLCERVYVKFLMFYHQFNHIVLYSHKRLIYFCIFTRLVSSTSFSKQLNQKFY